MLYKKIGDTEVPAIGQGTGGIFNPQIIKAGIDAGLTLIDTAESYGNESIVGEAIKGQRDKVFISTKFSPEHNSDVAMSCENSLSRLGTDYIDLYSMYYRNPYIPEEETAESLDRLQKDGKIRYIGICNTYTPFIGHDESHSVQVEYNLFDRTAENTLMPYCAENNIAMMAYSPLRDLYQLNPDSMIELREMHPDKSLSQIILNWIISHEPVIALASSKDIAHIRKNAACDFKLSDDELKKIDILFKPNVRNIPLSQIDISLSADRFPQTEADARTWCKWVVKPQDVNLDDFKPIKIEKSAYDDANRFPQTTYEVKEGGLRYWAWRIQKNEPIPSIIRHRWILDFKGLA